MAELKEEDLAARVVEWLEAQHWEVFQEVQPYRLGAVADIVARQGRLIWVIECKLSFGLAVIEQARHWRQYAHFSSVAVPESHKKSTHRTHAMARLIVRQFGIGLIEMSALYRGNSLNERVKPEFNRNALTQPLISALKPEAKTFAKAGNANGQHWTPFKETCEKVRRKVNEQPGIHMKELLASIQTHYQKESTARACLKMWIEKQKVPGVRLQKEGKYLRPRERAPDGAANEPPPPAAKACERIASRRSGGGRALLVYRAHPAAPSRRPRMGQRAVAMLLVVV